MSNYKEQLQANNEELKAILDTIIQELPQATPEIPLPSKDTSASASQVLAGKQFTDHTGQVITGTMPTVSAATPTLAIDYNTGKISATISQAEGYVQANVSTESTTLTTIEGQDIKPSTSDYMVAPAGSFNTGSITVQGDPNLLSENIKAGTSIFGVEGAFTGQAPRTVTVKISHNTTNAHNIIYVAAFQYIDNAYTSYTCDGGDVGVRNLEIPNVAVNSILYLRCYGISDNSADHSVECLYNGDNYGVFRITDAALSQSSALGYVKITT